MKIPTFEKNDFQISTMCLRGKNCVQVAHKEGVIAIADSKNPQQKPLHFDKAEWSAFIAGIKNGEFDYP